MEKTKQRGNVPVSKKTKKKSKTKSRSRNNIGVKLIEKPEYYDYNLVAAIILLTCFGLVMLYSTSAYTSTIKYGDDMYFFKKQAAISFVCIAGALFISMFDYHILARFTGVLYGVAAGSMVLVRTPLGTVSNGARRWLRIGPIQFQPAEIAKIAVIVCLSYMIVHMGKKMNSLKACMTLGAMGTFLALLAYVCTDNLSTAIIIFCITVGMIFVAHPKTRIFLILVAVAIAFLAILVFVIGQSVKETDDFRLNRIIAWLHPENATGTAAYQTIQALYAIGSGGFLGRGLGNSIQKLGSVPEAQNDMIFSIICEELGIVGGVILLLSVWISSLQAVFYRTECTGSFWVADCQRYLYTYCTAGNSEHCSRSKSDAKYRCHAAVYQLWRYLDHVPHGRDGTGLKRVQAD